MRPAHALQLLTLALPFAATAAAQSRTPATNPIEVGPNVRVSTDAQRGHREVHVTADPTHPNRLAACAIVSRDASYGIVDGSAARTVLYTSNDGGRTWARAVEDVPTLTRNDANGEPVAFDSWDPICDHGPDGMLYFATGTYVPGLAHERVIRVHRSSDGGRTWLSPAIIVDPPPYDRFWLMADKRPTSPFYGHVYVTYYATVPGDPSTSPGTLVASSDRGATFRAIGTFPDSTRPGPYGAVALADGALLLSDASSEAAVLVGTPDSQRFTRSTIAVLQERGYTSPPSLGVDASNGPFRDRIYQTWVQSAGRYTHVAVAYSTDRGRTWSAPRLVSDLPSGDASDVTGNQYPTLAVNRDGVVGISWYHISAGPRSDVRFRASLDGGETWLPSVRVSEHPDGPFQLSDARVPLPLWPQGRGATRDSATGSLSLTLARELGSAAAGDYSGLAATADGRFHAAWIAEQNGVRQVWTAPLRVRGRAGADPAIATLRDVTRGTDVAFDGGRFHPSGARTGRLVGTVTVTNHSADTLRAPLRLQAYALEKGWIGDLWSESRSGLAFDRGHPNWRSNTVWDVSAGLNGGVLPPGATSRPVPIAFALPRLVDGLAIRFPLQLRLFAGDGPSAASPASTPPARRGAVRTKR